MLGLFLLCTLGLGCRTAELSGGGSNVQIGPSAPADYGYEPTSCKPLGYIAGRGGGSFGGGWISNDQLVEYAMNDLRNKAAELGANYVQHESPQMGIAGDKDGVTTSTATVSGSAYLCTRRRKGGAKAKSAKPKTASKAEVPKPKQEVAQPTGLAGFTFGMTFKRASEACENASLEITPADSGLVCSGTPESIGVEGHAKVSLCHQRVCRVEVASNLEPNGAETLTHLGRLHKQLTKKYGPPAVSEVKLPGDCRKNAPPCLRNGIGSLRYRWKFPKGATIELWSERSEANVRLVLRYEYEAPPAL